MVCFYIGYFGAGAGFLLMSVLSSFGIQTSTRSALKVIATTTANGIAVVTFIVEKQILWKYCLLMMIAAALGGYLGARYARRISPAHALAGSADRFGNGCVLLLEAVFLKQGLLMSHEGIRFISDEEAAQRRAQEASHRDLPREATEPARVRVQKTTGTGMEIDWKDGHQSSWNFTGCVTPALAPPAMRSAEQPAASQASGSRSRPRCCKCTKHRHGRVGFARRPLRHQLSLE